MDICSLPGAALSEIVILHCLFQVLIDHARRGQGLYHFILVHPGFTPFILNRCTKLPAECTLMHNPFCIQKDLKGKTETRMDGMIHNEKGL